MPILDEIQYLAGFCIDALDKAFNFVYLNYRGYCIILGFLILWVIIDNFVPKG